MNSLLLASATLVKMAGKDGLQPVDPSETIPCRTPRHFKGPPLSPEGVKRVTHSVHDKLSILWI